MKLIKDGFPPVIDKYTEILILGTLPSDKSIKKREYYANPQNQFWRLMFALLNNNDFLNNYQDKINLLLRNKIGLWDVINAAERPGSLDANIHQPELNDFNVLFESHPNIKILAFNGDKAFKLYQNHDIVSLAIELVRLPSTSSANTGKTFIKKVEVWREGLIMTKNKDL